MSLVESEYGLTYKIDCNDKTLVVMACDVCAAIKKGNIRKLKELIKKKDCNLNHTHNGITPLYFAVEFQYYDILKELIKNKVNINSLYSNGTSSLIHACKIGNINILNLLLSSNCDINFQDIDGNTALHYACDTLKFNNQIIDILFNSNPNVNIQNNYGNTVLHLACNRKKINILNIILNLNPNINIQNNKNLTVLHVACKIGLIDAVPILLDNNSNIDLCENEYNFTALECSGLDIPNKEDAIKKRIEIFNQYDMKDLLCCKLCNKRRSESDEETLNICCICLTEVYCGKKCQITDWKNHKKICKNFKG
jgi:ankyrin repeat protein